MSKRHILHCSYYVRSNTLHVDGRLEFKSSILRGRPFCTKGNHMVFDVLSVMLLKIKALGEFMACQLVNSY
jgi:hypothetical protein